MQYEEVIQYLYSQLPMFHRIGAAAYKANLDNTHALMDALNHPHQKFKTIHIAGTNGKGSSSHMLAAIFAACGYKTGLYTSPHLLDFRERIRINGKMIAKEDVVQFVEEYKAVFEPIGLSFFEWTVGLAFHYFAKEKVDIAVIETGLGGRLDSTNVIQPELSLITNISFDHMALLGDTLEKISMEKAGIIKSEIPVVISERQKETANVFKNFSERLNSPLTFAADHYQAKRISADPNAQIFQIVKDGSILFDHLTLDLPGTYQDKNICGVLQAIDILSEKGWNLPQEKVVTALSNVKSRTGLLGRWQTIAEHPRMICDVGHNEAGIKEITSQLNDLTFDQLHFVIGMVNDKDVSKVLSLLPTSATYYFTKANLPRALNETELASIAERFQLNGKTFSTVAEAIDAAKRAANVNDLIFIGGSTFVVADALAYLQK